MEEKIKKLDLIAPIKSVWDGKDENKVARAVDVIKVGNMLIEKVNEIIEVINKSNS